MVRYSPLRAHIRRGEWSKGCPANWRTGGGERRGDEACARERERRERALPTSMHASIIKDLYTVLYI